MGGVETFAVWRYNGVGDSIVGVIPSPPISGSEDRAETGAVYPTAMDIQGLMPIASGMFVTIVRLGGASGELAAILSANLPSGRIVMGTSAVYKSVTSNQNQASRMRLSENKLGGILTWNRGAGADQLRVVPVVL